MKLSTYQYLPATAILSHFLVAPATAGWELQWSQHTVVLQVNDGINTTEQSFELSVTADASSNEAGSTTNNDNGGGGSTSPLLLLLLGGLALLRRKL